MRYEQESFTKVEKLVIFDFNSQGHSLVLITQRVGSCNFHFAMTPQQAHDMAKKLIDIANTAEGCQELADKAKARAMDVEAEKA